LLTRLLVDVATALRMPTKFLLNVLLRHRSRSGPAFEWQVQREHQGRRLTRKSVLVGAGR